VVLDKPNKYGSFCEPKEGLPKTEAEKCKFGMIGTPPNDCHCPPGKEFAGYQGCMIKTERRSCTLWPKPQAQAELEAQDYTQKCSTYNHGVSACKSVHDGREYECCCAYNQYTTD
jgi:hypothetical protein